MIEFTSEASSPEPQQLGSALSDRSTELLYKDFLLRLPNT
jgi:hypothetical protein